MKSEQMYIEIVVTIVQAKRPKWQSKEEDWNEAKEPIVIIVLEVRKKPDEIETVTRTYQGMKKCA